MYATAEPINNMITLKVSRGLSAQIDEQLVRENRPFGERRVSRSFLIRKALLAYLSTQNAEASAR